MTRNLLWRGMLVGILAALFATLFARVVAEPQIDLAIAQEALRDAHHAVPDDGDQHVGTQHANAHEAEEPEIVSRDTQKGMGLFTAMALYGAAVGGIFSLVFAYAYGRLAIVGPRSLALLLSLLAFLLIVIVPAIKYPQTPPAVGQHETVGMRTAAYFAMIALSIGAAVIAVKLRAIFARSLRPFDAMLAAVGAYIVIVALGQAVLPSIDEVPASFPASLLWSFRIAAIATQLVLWGVIGITFGILADKLIRKS